MTTWKSAIENAKKPVLPKKHSTPYHRCNHCGREVVSEPKACPRCSRTFFVTHYIALLDGQRLVETATGTVTIK